MSLILNLLKMEINSTTCIPLQLEALCAGKILHNMKNNETFKVIYVGASSIKLSAIIGCKVCIYPLSNLKLEDWCIVEGK